MGSKMVEVYYMEANVFVKGKYGDEISIDKVLSIRNDLVQKYGEHLCEIDIVYDKRKDGIHVTPLTTKVPNYHFKKYTGVDSYFVRYLKKGKGVYKQYTISIKDGSVTEDNWEKDGDPNEQS